MPYLQTEYRRYYYYFKEEYVPSHYRNATAEQRAVQEAVWRFKEGEYTEEDMEWFAIKVRWRYYKFNQQIVTFMPCTTMERHIKRWSRLADYLEKHTPNNVILYGVAHHGWDLTPKHMTGKSGKAWMKAVADYQEINYKGVVLIDDVLNTGESFRITANALIKASAPNVSGLFYAKTVKPDLPEKDS